MKSEVLLNVWEPSHAHGTAIPFRQCYLHTGAPGEFPVLAGSTDGRAPRQRALEAVASARAPLKS